MTHVPLERYNEVCAQLSLAIQARDTLLDEQTRLREYLGDWRALAKQFRAERDNLQAGLNPTFHKYLSCAEES